MEKKVEQMDKKFKNFLASKTIWGLLILISPAISALLGFDVSAEIGGTYESIIEIIGLILGIYGRWTANANITIGKYSK